VCGHHPHRVERLRRIANDIDIAAVEPVEEALQRRRRLPLERQRGGQKLLDRIARFLPQPPEQLPSSVERTGENALKKAIRRREVGGVEDRG
jgi:hypothetical protein